MWLILFLIALPLALYKSVRSPVWAAMTASYFYFAIPPVEFRAPTAPYQAGFFMLAVVLSWRSRIENERSARQDIDDAALAAARETMAKVKDAFLEELISVASDRALRGEIIRRSVEAVEEKAFDVVHEITPGAVIMAVRRAVQETLQRAAESAAAEAERVLQVNATSSKGNLRLALAHRIKPMVETAFDQIDAIVLDAVAELVTEDVRLVKRRDTGQTGPLGIPLPRGPIAGVLTNSGLWLHVLFIALTYIGALGAKHDRLAAMDKVTTTYLLLIPLIGIITAVRGAKQFRLFLWAWMFGVMHLCLNAINIWLRYGGRADTPGGQGNDANFLGAIAVSMAPLAFSLVMAEKSKVLRLGALGLAGIYTLGILACGSRGALLALVGAMGYWITFTARKGFAMGIASLAIAGFLAVAPDSFWERMGTMMLPKENNAWVRNELEPSAHERVVLWSLAIEVWQEAPLMGIGPMGYVYESAEKTQILSANERSRGMMTHNSWLQILSEYGIIGLAAWAGAYFFSFFCLVLARIKLFRFKDDPEWGWSRAYMLGLEAGMLGNAVAITFASFQWLDYQYWFMIIGPLALHVANETVEQREWFGERKFRSITRPPPRYGPPVDKGLHLDIDLHATPVLDR